MEKHSKSFYRALRAHLGAVNSRRDGKRNANACTAAETPPWTSHNHHPAVIEDLRGKFHRGSLCELGFRGICALGRCTGTRLYDKEQQEQELSGPLHCARCRKIPVDL